QGKHVVAALGQSDCAAAILDGAGEGGVAAVAGSQREAASRCAGNRAAAAEVERSKAVAVEVEGSIVGDASGAQRAGVSNLQGAGADRRAAAVGVVAGERGRASARKNEPSVCRIITTDRGMHQRV